MQHYLAIDIGASSGRHIVGYMDENQNMHSEEVYRFKNDFVRTDQGLTWPMDTILEQVVIGIQKAFERFPVITSLSIDTWGVDYVLLQGDEVIEPVFAYRDERTKQVISQVHHQISFAELYSISGCQFQPFNTIYQLFDDLKKGRLAEATDFLMIPEYLMYRLTGVKCREYTNASTTGLMDASTKQYSRRIIDRLGLLHSLFKPLSMPGKVLGRLLPNIAERVNGNLDVVLCATHDTASAVEALDIDEQTLYISSGTWSLLGVKRQKPITSHEAQMRNFSNEAGPSYVRFQKNIMGLWLIQCLEKETGIEVIELIEEAKRSSNCQTIDVNDSRFLSPTSIKQEIDSYLSSHHLNKAKTNGDYANIIFHSLAKSYQDAIDEMISITGATYTKIVIIGGGAKNAYLNELTKNYTKLEIEARPIEATAIGNLRVQMKGNTHEK